MKKVIVWILLVGLFQICYSADSSKKIEYKHQLLGFSVQYPDSWNIVSVDDYYSSLNNTKLSNKEWDGMLTKHASIPFFAVAKYKEPYEDLNPSFKVNTRPYGELKGQKLDALMKAMVKQFETMFDDFEIIDDVKEVKIGNTKAIHTKFNYTLVSEAGEDYPASSELWLIDKGEYFYVIGVGMHQTEKKEILAEIKEMISSIIIK